MRQSLKKTNIKPLLNEYKGELLKIYQNRLKQMILFGSYARGTNHSESDIDILLLLDEVSDPFGEIDRTSDLKFDFMMKYEVVITCIFSDTDKYEKMLEPIFYNIKREGIQI